MIKSITLLLKILIYWIYIPAFCMSSKRLAETDRKRSRPVTKRSIFKKNRLLMTFLALMIVLAMVASTIMVFNPFKGNEKTTNPIAVINTSMGTIRIDLFRDKMPITTANFINLANDGFYNGMIFHRISAGFMIQAGRYFPNGTQKFSPYGNIQFENSDVKHVDGAISMASSGAKVGGDAEFFICDGAQSFLDRDYAAFGVVINGIEVVRAIASAEHDSSFEPRPGGGKPRTDIIINSITIENE